MTQIDWTRRLESQFSQPYPERALVVGDARDPWDVLEPARRHEVDGLARHVRHPRLGVHPRGEGRDRLPALLNIRF